MARLRAENRSLRFDRRNKIPSQPTAIKSIENIPTVPIEYPQNAIVQSTSVSTSSEETEKSHNYEKTSGSDKKINVVRSPQKNSLSSNSKNFNDFKIEKAANLDKIPNEFRVASKNSSGKSTMDKLRKGALKANASVLRRHSHSLNELIVPKPKKCIEALAGEEVGKVIATTDAKDNKQATGSNIRGQIRAERLR